MAADAVVNKAATRITDTNWNVVQTPQFDHSFDKFNPSSVLEVPENMQLERQPERELERELDDLLKHFSCRTRCEARKWFIDNGVHTIGMLFATDSADTFAASLELSGLAHSLLLRRLQSVRILMENEM
jgi:hypothetical protein